MLEYGAGGSSTAVRSRAGRSIAIAVARAAADQELMEAGLLDGFELLEKPKNAVAEIAALKWFCVDRTSRLRGPLRRAAGRRGYMLGQRVPGRPRRRSLGLKMAGGSLTTMKAIAGQALAYRELEALAERDLASDRIQDAMADCLAPPRRDRGWPAPRRSPYEELGKPRSGAAAGLFSRVPERPQHVGFCLGNRPEYVILYFATLFAGGLPLLLDANFNTGEIEAIRSDCGLDALVTERSKAEALDIPGKGSRSRSATPSCRRSRGAASRASAPAGHRGPPLHLGHHGPAEVPGVQRARRGLGGAQLGPGDGDDPRGPDALPGRPLERPGVQHLAASTFVAGGELHFLKGAPLTRPVARRIEESGITRLVAFPTLYRNFVAPGGPEPSAMAGLRLCDLGRRAALARRARGVPRSLRPRHLRLLRDRRDRPGHVRARRGIPCRARPAAAWRRDADRRRRRGCRRGGGGGAGAHRVHGQRISEPSGAVRAARGCAGFLPLGDRGRIVDGRLHLVGRTQDHINVAGRKIDPTEIVALVSALDGVADAVAFPDEDLNREALVHLVVVASNGGVTKASVAEACRSRLAPWKVPGRISFVQEIPRTGIGKPRIAVLREQLTTKGIGGMRRRSDAMKKRVQRLVFIAAGGKINEEELGR